MKTRILVWTLAFAVLSPLVAMPTAVGQAAGSGGRVGAVAEGQGDRTSRASFEGCEITNESASVMEIRCARADDFVWGFQLSCSASGHEIEYFAGSGSVAAIDFHDEPLAFRMVSNSDGVNVTERDVARIMQGRMVFALGGNERVFELGEDEQALLQRCVTRRLSAGTSPSEGLSLPEDRTSGLAVTAFQDCLDCPPMRVLPSGVFRMGSTEGEPDERPVHDVRVRAFALGRFEVTRGQYEAFVTATNHASAGCNVVDNNASFSWSTQASWRGPGFRQGDRHPVVCVSWDDAQAYVQWLSASTGERYRMPSEAEWEYGVRANTVTSRYWDTGSATQCDQANGGDRALVDQVGDWPVPIVNCNDGAAYTAPVGSYPPNAFGLYDMLGNAWEWTADCYHDDYAGGAPVDGSAWTLDGDCDRPVLRGGSWETAVNGITSTNRYRDDDGITASSLWGFRVARDIR